MNILILLPLLIPFFAAILTLFFRERIQAQRIIFSASSGLVLLVSFLLLQHVFTAGTYSVQVGGWEAPFGISFVVDKLAAIMIAISGLMAFASSFYAFATIDKEREKFGFYTLLSTLFMGINGSFLTGDIFNLYVWFEVMLMSSFVLISLGGTKAQLEGAIKYVTHNLVSSLFFLIAVGILYGIAGTLNMADLAVKIPAIREQWLVTTVAIFFLIAFGIKSAVFPLFFWLPASYHTPPAVVSAVFAGMLTKVGVYAMIRVFTLIFDNNTEVTHTILLVISGFTMVVGVLGAAAQNDIRRILSFHIVSQIGYMIMGLALNSPLALAGAIFYIMHHIIVKTNLFLVGGIIREIKGSYALDRLGGVYKAYPLLGLLFLVPALSLAGIPPLSGFWAKFSLVKAGFAAEAWLITGVSLFVSILTLYSMMKIWNEVFWKDLPEDVPEIDRYSSISRNKKIMLIAPAVALAVCTLVIGFYTAPFFDAASESARELLNKTDYINSVLRFK